jgi:hypothetical protein
MSNSPDLSDYDIPYSKSEDEYDNDNDNEPSNTPIQIVKKEPVKHKIQLKKKLSIIDIQNTEDLKNPIINSKTSTKTSTKTIIKPKEQKESKESKLTTSEKLEEKFEFDEETINFFSKDLDARKILIVHNPNSPILEKINDTKVICLLLKLGHFKDYRCNTPKCKVGKIWIDKPIQLILNRINNNQNDLSFINLELICANCFMIKYGLDIFIKKKAEIILTCSICDFPLVKFKNGRKSKGICLACEKQMNRFSYEKQEDEFCNKLQNMYSDNPVLSDDIKHTKYYGDASKYKNYDTNSSSNSTANSTAYSKKNTVAPKSSSSPLPLIELNMSMPNLFDLIEDDNDEELKI